VAAIVDGPDLAAHLGGNPDPALCDLCAAAGSAAVAAVVDPLDPDDVAAVWPDELVLVALDVATEHFKNASSPGGGFQMDEFVVAEVRLTSGQMRKYEPVLAKYRAVGGMVG